ncbi:ubiquitin-conjugating enzyme E2 Z-like isoform X2 [Bradysia coprophila]|uniref:ubiquitin-conjugating enzyme E2 Z-like isoform X1 n=1 Tax=Bradysia coprophila TaxID=38358 RepID=UPI00187D9B4A|nr:ubiquitin-conjugating enzyme E2 Z-like isoform X1 [Bradysia coprophila]XP_037034567.1 ubiquitin-conjugating enzyme E2 Z-like isoform X2 [Bradysia coprophila]
MALPLNVLAGNKLNLDNNWDPTKPDKDDSVPSKTVRRIMNDILECITADSQRIIVVPDPVKVLQAHAVIVGPENTPYEGGFFYFFVKFPVNYPISPPRLKLMNTDQNTIRFNPNFYRNGMVCLSILGTYTGSGWNPLNSLFSVLISILTLLNDNPYYNALALTGFKEYEENTPEKYVNYIRHETIRVAVINFLKEDNLDTMQMPSSMRYNVKKIFKQKIKFYHNTITDNMCLDDEKMFDPFNHCINGQLFEFRSLKVQLGELTKKLFGDIDDIQEQSECSELSDPSDSNDSN